MMRSFAFLAVRHISAMSGRKAAKAHSGRRLDSLQRRAVFAMQPGRAASTDIYADMPAQRRFDGQQSFSFDFRRALSSCRHEVGECRTPQR